MPDSWTVYVLCAFICCVSVISKPHFNSPDNSLLILENKISNELVFKINNENECLTAYTLADLTDSVVTLPWYLAGV